MYCHQNSVLSAVKVNNHKVLQQWCIIAKTEADNTASVFAIV